MLNKKRKGFTLMEIVLVMVLIAILATGVAIGFTSYINRGHETGITTDFNSTFSHPTRMEAIEKGRLISPEKLEKILISDGFEVWSDITRDIDVADGSGAIGVMKGTKKYEIKYVTTAGDTTMYVIARHSSQNSTLELKLNTQENDVISTFGTMEGTTFTQED